LDEREDLITGDMSSPLPRVVRDMCLAALETSSLPSGVKPKRHELPLPRGYFFRSLHSISYLEYQPFFIYSESKAWRIE